MERFEEQKIIERTLKRLSGKSEEPVNPVCPSVQYDGKAIQPCGEGWICPKCQGPGDGLKTVQFWSEKFSAWLDLTIPEKDLYDYQKVIAARTAREEAK